MATVEHFQHTSLRKQTEQNLKPPPLKIPNPQPKTNKAKELP